MKLKLFVGCISLIIIAVCAFVVVKMRAEDKPAIIGLKTDKIVIKDGMWIGIDSVADRERILETVDVREDSEGGQGR